MRVYIYAAALWCEDCGDAIRARLSAEGNSPDDADDESSFDSDDYPNGPYPDGGGEADSPQHCDGCHAFLENDLTEEGLAYVKASVQGGKGACVDEWSDYYRINRILPAVYSHVGAECGDRLPLYADGGYTLRYFTKDCDVFCRDCAHDSDTGETITAVEVFWEGPADYCAHCNEPIESAYGDHDAEDGNGDVEPATE